MKVGIVITARPKSNRIMEKSLALINGRPAMDILLKRLSFFENVVIGTIDGIDDYDYFADDSNVKVFKGEESPLHRINEICEYYEFDHVVRITTDDILIDADLLRRQIDFHIKNNLHYTYMGRCPVGVAGEVISSAAIKKLSNEMDGVVEFISYYLKDRGKFSYREFWPPREYQDIFRVCIDYPEDLKLVRSLFSILGNKFGTLDIIHLHRKYPDLFDINKQPEISYYTCNHNYGEYISECIHSILTQKINKFVDWEYLIIDDYSTDDSMNIIFESLSLYPDYIRNKIKVLRNRSNLGLYESSNIALDMIKGKYVMRVDADDKFLDEGAVMLMYNECNNNNAEAVISGYIRDGEYLDEHRHSGCALIKTRIANEFRYKNNINFAQGTKFFEEFEKSHNLYFIPRPFWLYRKHEDSITARRESA